MILAVLQATPYHQEYPRLPAMIAQCPTDTPHGIGHAKAATSPSGITSVGNPFTSCGTTSGRDNEDADTSLGQGKS